MPIYEYVCVKCQKISEFILLASDKAPKKCPSCGGKLQKLVSSPAIRFKGSGWYITDYARKSASGNGEKKAPEAAKDAKDSKEPAPAAAASTPASSTPSKDSKPAADKKS